MKKIQSIIILGFAIAVVIGCTHRDEIFLSDFYKQEDHIGRPLTSIFYIDAAFKDVINSAQPRGMRPQLQTFVEERITDLNPDFDRNVKGQFLRQYSEEKAIDVLQVKVSLASNYNTNNGRALADDVVDRELTLLYGGENGQANSGKTSDNVNRNDKQFRTTFPYFATAW